MRIACGVPVARVRKAPRHSEVNQENQAALEPKNQILPPPGNRRDALSFDLSRHLGRLERPGQACIVDVNRLEGSSDERGLEPRPDRLYFGQLRHLPRVAPAQSVVARPEAVSA